MRILLLSVAAIIVCAMSDARAQNCPADASKASFEVWPRGRIPDGRTVTGKHPCGRSIVCTGGSGEGAPGTRRCHWR